MPEVKSSETNLETVTTNQSATEVSASQEQGNGPVDYSGCQGNDVNNSSKNNCELTVNEQNGGPQSLSREVSTCSSISPTNSRAHSPNFMKKKYVSLIDRIHKREKSRTPFFSLEFFPPRTQSGALNLISR